MSCCLLVSAAICCYLLPNMSPRWSKKPAKPPGMVPEGPQGVPRWPPGVSKRPPGRLPRHHLRTPGKPKIVPGCLPGPLRTTSRDFEPEFIDFGCQNRSKKRRKTLKNWLLFQTLFGTDFCIFFVTKIPKNHPKNRCKMGSENDAKEKQWFPENRRFT